MSIIRKHFKPFLALLDAKKLEKYETAEGVKITGSALKTAIQAIEEYKKSQVGGPPPLQPTRDDPFDQLLTTPTAQQSPTVKKVFFYLYLVKSMQSRRIISLSRFSDNHAIHLLASGG